MEKGYCSQNMHRWEPWVHHPGNLLAIFHPPSSSLPWAKIFKEQIDTAPFTDIYGVQHQEKRHRSWNSFMECVQLHLQSIFRYDAAEMLRFYISNGLKKPNRVPIRDFLQRVECLNGYLTLLPCLYHCKPKTRVVLPYTCEPTECKGGLREIWRV